ncbi:MAG: NAD+ synthase [Candidatus Omnitrophota bacterium]|nr:NAD+ synthase [Candidatus Omnitrophota bacterium]MDZ4242012.1 NAD+ synthase [Candidatus Omnitrophota bacterium]
MIRVALAQINTTVGNISGNCGKILDALSRAKAQAADIVVFPELAVTGYPPEDLLHKDRFVRDQIRALRSLAGKVRGISAVIGFVDTGKDKRLYNAAAVISGGRIAGVVHKKELPNYGVFDEKRYFSEGVVSPLFLLNGSLIGINICEDIWVKNSVSRDQARAGARLIINISSSPFDWEKLELRKKILVERARSTGGYLCYANLVGGQDELVFDGGSMVLDPRGRIMAAGRQFEEDLVVADLDVPRAARPGKKAVVLSADPGVKKAPLSPRKAPGPLSRVERIHKALVLGTRDYVLKNGFQKVVIGLSGGVDSSLVAAIARQALGAENVIGVSMPSRFSSEGTRSDARQTAENLGIRFLEIPIEDILKSFLKTLEGEFSGLPFGLAEENLQARIRGTILMTFSNKFGWLVLTTGNKSEIGVGYCTLYGDMSGGFAVIKDVPKTTVYELARFVNDRSGAWIPESVIDRAPTAELRENQKDQDSLPPYDVLDEILKGYVEDHQSVERLSRGRAGRDLVSRVIRLIDRSEYKRRQAPPGVKITPRAFGKDWRLPITNGYDGAK